MTVCPPPQVPEALLRDGAVELCRGCGHVFVRDRGRWRELVPIERHAYDAGGAR